MRTLMVAYMCVWHRQAGVSKAYRVPGGRAEHMYLLDYSVQEQQDGHGRGGFPRPNIRVWGYSWERRGFGHGKPESVPPCKTAKIPGWALVSGRHGRADS